jgi:hypothetical protein
MHGANRIPHVFSILCMLLLLAACGSTPATPEQAESTGGEDATTAGAVTVRDPWVRMAVMTGAADAESMMEEELEKMEEGGDDAMTATDEMTHTGAMTHTKEMTATDGMTPTDAMTGSMAHGHGGGTSAAYMTVVNNTDTDDAIIGAATDVAETVELHTVTEGESGMMQMRPVEEIAVPANGEVELKPGGFHVMLIDLTQDLNEGDTVDLTLTLENAGEVEISAPVRMAE